MNDADIIFRADRGAGRMTLNRPKAINALTYDMVRAMDAQLVSWARDSAIRFVLIDGAGERGLCAGGDIRALYEDAKAGRIEGPAGFFGDEYKLNARIARYKKPIVVFQDGIVMGGGIGISAHASHRVVTPRAILAMPEVGIGFLPDVGGTYLLSRAPGELGTHAALTAGRLGPADAILCGLSDLCVDAARLPELAEALPADGDLDATLRRFSTQPPPGVLEAGRSWIDACYSFDTVEEIVARLEAEPQAGGALTAIRHASPTSLKITLRALRRARDFGQLEPCLQQEYDAALHCMRSHDFVEGVRAAVVDKDRHPKWKPAALADVSEAQVEAYFTSSPQTQLKFAA